MSWRTRPPSVRVTGEANLLDKKPFKANVVASRFNPADFGDFPQADVNAEIDAAGALAPQWQVADSGLVIARC